MRLHHPLWTHLPAVALVGLVVASFWWVWPLPDPAPVHFGANGMPDRWGSPWEMPVIVSFVALVAVLISVAVDESWARHERRKRFNAFALADELLVGLLAAVTLQYVAALATEPYLIRSSWRLPAVLMVGAGLAAAALELARPLRLSVEEAPPPADSLEEEYEIGEIAGRRWAYWESQNPRYSRLYLPIFGVGLVVLGLTSWSESRWLAAFTLVMGLVVLLTCTGGFRVMVTRDRLTVRGGLAGLPLLKLGLADIDRAEVHTFSPLADFGGYGIRRNRQMKAFFLEGNAGVRLETASGATYLIGSRQPGRLAAVIRAAMAQAKK